MLDPYVYPGTNILRNILGIQDRQILDDAEADYVSLRLRELAENPLEGSYDVNHFAKMHKYIFQDIYEWAGKIRTINIEKEEPALVLHPGRNYSFVLAGTGASHTEQNRNDCPDSF